MGKGKNRSKATYPHQKQKKTIVDAHGLGVVLVRITSDLRVDLHLKLVLSVVCT